MRFEWDEAKRRENIKRHRIDFVNVEQIFIGETITFLDDRLDYGEERFLTFGLLRGRQPHGECALIYERDDVRARREYSKEVDLVGKLDLGMTWPVVERELLSLSVEFRSGFESWSAGTRPNSTPVKTEIPRVNPSMR